MHCRVIVLRTLPRGSHDLRPRKFLCPGDFESWATQTETEQRPLSSNDDEFTTT